MWMPADSRLGQAAAAVEIPYISISLCGSSLVNDRLMLAHFAATLRNSFVVACLTSGIVLCSVRIGFIRRSNSITRPLAKLAQAVKVADASNQRKAKCKTVSAIAVALREDTKSFDKADNVFNKDTIF